MRRRSSHRSACRSLPPPDANLVIYAYDAEATHHQAAREWWEEVLSGSHPVGIPWVVVLAFTRLMTHPTMAEDPMTVDLAHRAVRAWLLQDHVRLLSPTVETFELFFSLLENAGTGGNLSTDAMIAALAMEAGGRVYSNDRDFGRFPDLAWTNPLSQ